MAGVQFICVPLGIITLSVFLNQSEAQAVLVCYYHHHPPTTPHPTPIDLLSTTSLEKQNTDKLKQSPTNLQSPTHSPKHIQVHLENNTRGYSHTNT